MKHKIYTLFLSVIFLSVNDLSGQTAVVPALGTGISNDPYRIETLSNFYWLSQNSADWVPGNYFIQTADIDASATSTWFSDGSGGYYGFPTIGGGSDFVGNQEYGSFSGNYDGQGFSISNLYINRAPDYVALFGYCDEAGFKNIHLVNPTVLVGSTGGSASTGYQGAAIFAASGSASVDNVHISGGTLTINSWHGYFGGMFGRGIFQGTNSSVDATINATTTFGGPGGGFFGYSEFGTGTFRNCYSTGSISANFDVGGFVGMTYLGNNNFNECYSKMSVTSTSSGAGGFAAWAYNGGATYNNCFATGAVSGSVAGGFYGDAYMGASAFNSCYSIGAVNGAMSGGFGGNAVTHTFSNCFWDTQTSGTATAFGTGADANVVGRITPQMRTESTFTGATWDFVVETTNGTNDYWFIDATENNAYPSLRGDIREWIGTTSNSWSTPTNWKNGLLPNSTSIVRISNSAANLPAITSNVTIDRFCFSAAILKLDIGNNTLTSNGILKSDADHYIKTSGTGTLKMTIADQQFLTFPIGLSAYNPVSITNRTGTADDFSAIVLDEVHVNGSGGATVSETRVQRTWNISKTAANAGSGVNFVFNWNAGETSGTLGSPSLYHYGGNWDKQTGTTSSNAASLSYSGYTGTFSPFAIASGSMILPVNWVSFTGTKHADAVKLEWTTAAESGTADYIVQHKTDLSGWAFIGTVTAAGSSSSQSNYSFLHKSPASGNNYYRLIQRDRDGKETFSKTVTLNFEETAKSLSAYPNPVVNGKLNIRTEKAVSIRVYNSEGALVLQQTLQRGTNQILTNKLTAGIYYIKSGTETLQIVVK